MSRIGILCHQWVSKLVGLAIQCFFFEIHYELPFCCDFFHETPVILRHTDRSTVDLLVTFSSLRVFNSAKIP